MPIPKIAAPQTALSSRILVLTFLSWTVFFMGCSAEFKDYTAEESTSTTEELSECEQTALTSFSSQIQPTITSSCATANCHGQSVPNLPFSADTANASTNRTALLTWVSSDLSNLTKKLDGTTSHGGGKLLPDTITQTKLDTWFESESACN